MCTYFKPMFVLILAFAFSNSVIAQTQFPGPNGNSDGHKCSLHPTTDHNGGWRRISIKNGPIIPEVTLDDEVWVVLHSHTEENFTQGDV